jgi:ABC-type Na+ efflux pump permease subunit
LGGGLVKAALYAVGSFVVVVALVSAILLLAGAGGVRDDNPLVLMPLLGLFGIAPIGGFWMMYQAIRYEKSPFPLIGLAAFIPFAFVWYYLERYRPDRERRTPERFGADSAD